MKWINKLLTLYGLCTLLTVSNCFAVSLDKTNITDDKLNCYRTYLVQEDEQENFIENIEKSIEVLSDKYTFDSYTIEGGITKDTIDISTTKTITSYTNSLESILSQLGEKINYEQDGFIGEYLLNTQNIQVETNYNGFREDLIEENISYSNLSRNDLDFIPKQTIKDGLTLDLLKVEWEVQTKKMIGEYEVADLYTAKCYYATKQRIDYPNTYTITAEYQGTATKEVRNPYKYTVKYNKIEEKIEPIPEVKNTNLIPIISVTAGILFIIIFLFTRNVTVYNYRDGNYYKIGKTRIHRNNTIYLNRFSFLETTNKYKIELSKNLTDKLRGKVITISKGNTKLNMFVSTNDDKYSIETII